ncbi:MAG: pyruvate kinase [Acidobacteriaceae bacterium]
MHTPLSPTPTSAGLRRAKIVATLGPSSNTEPTFRDLIRAGLDVARLNFSHGTHPEKLKLIQMIRQVAAEERKPICILGDLQGPKIRTGRLKNRIPVSLKAGQHLTITPRDVPGTSAVIGTTFPTLAENLEEGSRILLSDGLIELRVTRVRGGDVECDVINGGMLGEHKGINLPGISVRVPSLTGKDEIDLEFAIKSGVDMVAVSFVRTAEDVRLVKQRVAALGAETWIIAKLEKPQAIEHLEAILQIADGVMVARGDLGVEMPPEQVPAIQKRVIRRAAELRKPVITATQMLESMIENPRPTRAEASDVANAIYDGTDAVMLSAESAAGKYPIEAVAMMAKIVVETEIQMRAEAQRYRYQVEGALSIPETICESMAHAADDLDLSAIAVFTETGTTARLLSKYHPVPPIYALSSVDTVIRRMMLLWGVHPVQCPKQQHTDQMVDTAERLLLQAGLVRNKQILGIVAGTRTKSGSTNFMRLHMVGDSDHTARKRRESAGPAKAATKAAKRVAAAARSRQSVPGKVPAAKGANSSGGASRPTANNAGAKK